MYAFCNTIDTSLLYVSVLFPFFRFHKFVMDCFFFQNKYFDGTILGHITIGVLLLYNFCYFFEGDGKNIKTTILSLFFWALLLPRSTNNMIALFFALIRWKYQCINNLYKFPFLFYFLIMQDICCTFSILKS